MRGLDAAFGGTSVQAPSAVLRYLRPWHTNSNYPVVHLSANETKKVARQADAEDERKVLFEGIFIRTSNLKIHVPSISEAVILKRKRKICGPKRYKVVGER